MKLEALTAGCNGSKNDRDSSPVATAASSALEGDVLTASLIACTVGSIDPNDKVGPPGIGGSRYALGTGTMAYAISFENKPTATAAAQEVTITDHLPLDKVDVSTLGLGPVSLGDVVVVPPPGLTQYSTDVDVTAGSSFLVRINAGLDRVTGTLTWSFVTLDPETMLPTDDPMAGFLPPNVNSPEGQGSVLFSVMPKSDLPTGQEIRNKASIVFDTNAPIVTPEWINTIDNDQPHSQVGSLAAIQSSTTFDVQWAGNDLGAGVGDYTVYVSENGGPFVPFVTNTAATSATFSGEVGKRYGFYSIARDKVGLVETAKTQAEATTRIRVPGDVNDDGIVDCADLGFVRNLLGAVFVQPSPADVVPDGKINVRDLAFVSRRLAPGTTCQ